MRLVFPTISTFRLRALVRHSASREAGARFFAKYWDPAVVTTPLTSIRSLTARRNRSIGFRRRPIADEGAIFGRGAPCWKRTAVELAYEERGDQQRGKTGEQVFTILAKRTEVKLGNQPGIDKERKNLFSSIEKGSYGCKFTVASIV